MKNFKRYLKIFLLYSKYALKTTFQTRVGTIFFLLGKFVRFIFFFFLVLLIFTKVKLIKGYTINQAIIFYLTFNLIDTITQIVFREVYRFKYAVVSGDFNLTLTRPHHPFLKILVGGIDFLDIIMLIPYLLLTFYYLGQLPTYERQTANYLLYFLLIINGLVIATAFHIAVLAMGILTTETDNTIMIYRDLTNLARFPLDIYRSPLREILTFIIPVGVMISFPAQALFNLLTWPKMVYAFILSGGLLLFSLKFWDYSLKKYQSWGG